MNSAKEVKDICAKNYNMLMTEIEECIQKWKDISC